VIPPNLSAVANIQSSSICGEWTMEEIIAHPAMLTIRRLATRDEAGPERNRARRIEIGIDWSEAQVLTPAGVLI